MTPLTKLNIELYTEQTSRWPKSGRCILAQFDADSIVVYTAYSSIIGNFAAQNGYFGDSFSFTRMSWIKPNFLWMMYRCGWAHKEDQKVVLAIRIARSHFEELLHEAVYSSFVHHVYGTQAQWRQEVERSLVRLQWDPDYHPSGAKLERRAIQLGFRGDVLANFAKAWIINIEDISEFVREQYLIVKQGRYDQLFVPYEDVYPITDKTLSGKLGLTDGS